MIHFMIIVQEQHGLIPAMSIMGPILQSYKLQVHKL